MTWQTEAAEAAQDLKEAYGRTVTVTTKETLSESYSPTTGGRTSSAAQEFEVTAWSSEIRPVDDKLDERTFYICVADFDIDIYGKPGPGWTITDADAPIRPTETPWSIAAPAAVEFDGAVWALVCRRAH